MRARALLTLIVLLSALTLPQAAVELAPGSISIPGTRGCRDLAVRDNTLWVLTSAEILALDAATGAVTSRRKIPKRSSPKQLLTAGGYLWLTPSLVRMEVSSEEVNLTSASVTNGIPPCIGWGLNACPHQWAVGGEALWLAVSGGWVLRSGEKSDAWKARNRIYRIEPSANRVSATIPLEPAVPAYDRRTLAACNEALWAVFQSGAEGSKFMVGHMLSRIDPSSGRSEWSHELPRLTVPADLACSGDEGLVALKVVHPARPIRYDLEVLHIRGDTQEPRKSVLATDQQDLDSRVQIITANGSVWIAYTDSAGDVAKQDRDNWIVEFDRQDGQVTRKILLAKGKSLPRRVAYAAGSPWICEKEIRRVPVTASR